MKTAIILCIVLALSVNALPIGRQLKKDASASSKSVANSAGSDTTASAASSAFATDGEVKSVAIANSETVKIVQDECAKAISTFIIAYKDGHDVDIEEKKVLKAVSSVFVGAYVSTLASVESTSEGNFGCAHASGTAHEKAVAYAEAYLKGAIIALKDCGYDGYDVKALGEAGSIAKAVAEVYAEADSYACLHGKGISQAQQDSYATAVATAIATVIVKLKLIINGNANLAQSESVAKSDAITDVVVELGGSSSVIGNGNAVATGDATATAEKVDVVLCLDSSLARCCKTTQKFGLKAAKNCYCGFKCKAEAFTENTGKFGIKIIKGGFSYDDKYSCTCNPFN